MVQAELPHSRERRDLTEAFTKLLIPGTIMRVISAWVISHERLLYIDSTWIDSHILYAPRSMKQCRSYPAAIRVISW